MSHQPEKSTDTYRHVPVPGYPVAVLGIVGVAGVLAPVLAAYPALRQSLELSTAGLARGDLWQIVTYPLVHLVAWPEGQYPDSGLLVLLFSAVLLTACGAHLERQWGRAPVLWLALGTTVGMAALHVLLAGGRNVATGGLLGVALAVATARTLMFPRVLILGFFPVYVFFATAAAGCLLAVAQTRAAVAPASVGWSYLPHVLVGLPAGALATRAGGIRSRVVLWWHTRRIFQQLRYEMETKAEVDRLLGVIHDRGLGTLKRSERRFLESASDLYRRSQEAANKTADGVGSQRLKRQAGGERGR